jgi:hypothetical protein
LCLGSERPQLIFEGPERSFFLVLTNAPHEPTAPEAVLSAHLIFEAESLDAGADVANRIIANILNCLAYTTNRKFMLKSLKRVIDWTPGIVQREALLFVEKPEWDVAEPGLDVLFVTSAERIMSMQGGEEQQAAMRWYRLALQTETVDEQYSCFWFALEIAAQFLKPPDRIASKCPRCQGPLLCPACNTQPLHRRYPGEAIRHLVERVHPKDVDEIFGTLQLIRHTLMHGGRIEAFRNQLPCSSQEAIDKLAAITRQAIGLMFSNPDPDGPQPLTIGVVPTVVRRRIVGSAYIQTAMRGNPEEPDIRDFPKIDFQIVQD